MRVRTEPEDWQGSQLGEPDTVRETIWGAISRIADKLSEGRKAVPVTEGLIAAGLVEHPERLRQITREHEEVLDEYFEQIDVEALAKQLQAGDKVEEAMLQQGAKIGESLAFFGLGAAAMKGIDFFRNAK